MVRRQIELFTSIALFFVLAGSARATIMWGVTGTDNMSDTDVRSEVFTIDTSDWSVTKLYTTTLDKNNLGTNYSDIVVTPSGSVYTIGSDYKGGGGFFQDFFRLDPTTGQATDISYGINPRCKPINALTALNDTTLLAIEGGRAGIVHPHLIQINLDPVTGHFAGAIDLGAIYTKPGSSGGDIVKSVDGEVFLASLGGGVDFYQIDYANPNAATLTATINLPKTAGLAYDYDAEDGPKLLAGQFTNQKISSINTVTGQTEYVLSLSNHLQWNTFGLDSVNTGANNIPEPTTIFLLGLGSLVFLRNRPS